MITPIEKSESIKPLLLSDKPHVPRLCNSSVLALSELSRQCVVLNFQQLFQSPDVTLFVGEVRVDKCADEFRSNFFTDDPGSQAKHVHVIVLDPLMCRIDIVTDPGSNSRNFVCRDADPDATTADKNPSFGMSSEDGFPDFPRKVGIVNRAV